MYASPQFVSKHAIEKQERATRDIARIVVCLLTAFAALSVTTYWGYARSTALCRQVDAIDASKLRSLGGAEFPSIKAAQEECQ